MDQMTDFQIKDGCLEKYLGQDAAVVIPDGVTSIGTRAFNDCATLTSVIIPASVKHIGWGAFKKCPALTAVTLPDGVTEIGDYAFTGDAALTDLKLPGSVKTIGRFAFSNCAALHGLDLPACIESIGDFAFYLTNCFMPTHLVIPGCLTHIGFGVFRDSSVQSIRVAADNPVYDSREDCNAIIETATNTLLYGCRNTVLPKTVTRLCSSFGDDKAETITLHDGVTEIGNCVFFLMRNLTTVNLPDSLTRIGESAFSGCSALTSITIPDGVTEIDGWAFEGCSKLASITLGSGLESIGPVAFSGCDKLTDVYFRGTEAQWKTLSVDAGNDAILNANIHFIA